jgi:hypothetical protein
MSRCLVPGLLSPDRLQKRLLLSSQAADYPEMKLRQQ